MSHAGFPPTITYYIHLWYNAWAKFEPKWDWVNWLLNLFVEVAIPDNTIKYMKLGLNTSPQRHIIVTQMLYQFTNSNAPCFICLLLVHFGRVLHIRLCFLDYLLEILYDLNPVKETHITTIINYIHLRKRTCMTGFPSQQSIYGTKYFVPDVVMNW